MAVTLNIETGAAPQGGTETVIAKNFATQKAFYEAAATALSARGGFIEVETEKEGKTETAQYNINKIRSAV
jgi:hypothetical protein